MPAGEIITQDGRRCTKVKKNGDDATSIFSTTSTATTLDTQATATSLTQEGVPSSSDADGKFSANLIIASLPTSTSVPISSSANTGAGILLETPTLLDNFSQQSAPSSTEGSGLNLPTGLGNSPFTTQPPGGSASNSGPDSQESASDGDGEERASPQNPGVIAGGIIGAVILIVIIIVAWICIRRKRRQQRLAESTSTTNSNNNSAVMVQEKLSDSVPASTRDSQLPARGSYSTFATKRGGIAGTSEARNSGTPLVQSETQPNSQYLGSATVAEEQPEPPRGGIRAFAAGVLGKLRGLYPPATANTPEDYTQQPSQVSSSRSSYSRRTTGTIPQRRLSESSIPRPRVHDAPMPEMLNPFADPSSTNGVQRSPGFWRSPLARNPFEDPAPPDEDFPFPSPLEASNRTASNHQYHHSGSSSVIVLPNSTGESIRSVSLDATASEISRWRRERDSQLSARSDPFDLERSASMRSNNARRTTIINTARNSQYLAP